MQTFYGDLKNSDSIFLYCGWEKDEEDWMLIKSVSEYTRSPAPLNELFVAEEFELEDGGANKTEEASRLDTKTLFI